MKMRLNKFLADRDVASRREADRLIERGSVKVNGVVAALGTVVDESDIVVVNGETITSKQPDQIFIAFHKPAGLITSVDPTVRDSVISYIKFPEKIFPIGRLDVASSGLLLLTNDGRLSEAITNPRFHHEKEYVVTVDRTLQTPDLRRLASGVHVLGSKTKPATIIQKDAHTFHFILTEGRNRQIRRMCEELGYEVKKLRRVRIMNITLGDLALGKWRYLTSREVETLKGSL